MNNLLQVLNSLSGAVFLPFLIGAALYLAINVFPKRKKEFPYIFAGIFLLLSWRIIFTRSVNSSRYYLFFTYVGLLLSAWVLDRIIKIIPGSSRHKGFFLQAVVISLIIVLLFFCSQKNLKQRNYNHNIEYLCEMALNTPQSNRSRIIIENKEKDFYRYKYYLKQRDSNIYSLNEKTTFEGELERLMNSRGSYYCITNYTPEENMIETKTNKYHSKMIASFLTKRRGKKRLVLYEVEPDYPNIISAKQLNDKVVGKTNLCKNGDFSIIETAQTKIEKSKKYIKEEKNGLYAIPKDWNVYENNGTQRCQLIKETDSSHSLLIQSVWGKESIVMSSPIKLESDCSLYISVKCNNIADSELKIKISNYDSVNKRTAFEYTVLPFFLERGKEYVIKEDIILKDFPLGTPDFFLTFMVNGMIKIENVYVIRK